MQKISTITLAVVACLSFTTTSALAEESKQDDTRIIITGSHIKRIQQESSSPLAIITAEEISRSGVTTLAELLQTTVYSNGGSQNNQQTGGFTPGAASYNLRGLRTDRTLVLVDGKRLPSYPFGQNGNVAFVDLNTIPLAEIESVQILKDGASAVYGSDAISGVVNIITKQKFQANELTVKTTQSDGNYQGNFISYLGGYSGDNSELVVVAEFQDYKALLGADNENTANLAIKELNEYSFPGTYFDNSLFATAGEGCDRVIDASEISNTYSGQACANDWASQRQLTPENQRMSASLKWSYYLGDLAFYTSASANKIETDSDVPFGLVRKDFLNIAASDPINPIGQDIAYFSRAFTEFGLQNINTTADNYRFTLGLNGLIGEYDFDLAFNHGLTQVDEVYAEGWMTKNSRNALFAAIDNGEINPFQQLTQAQVDSYTSQFLHEGKSYQSALSFNMSGELTEWDSGSVYFASGVEVRKESIRDTSDDDILNNQVVGLGNSSAEGDRDIKSIFSEFVLPASEIVELNLALRYDNYSDFGTSFNPKASIKVTPSENFLVRASWGTGFRAPNLFELYSGEVSGTSQGFPFISTGNLDLDAETSESFNLGMVMDFPNAYMLSIDAWQIDVEDMITNLGVNTIVNSFDENGDRIYDDYIIFDGNGDFSHIYDPFLNIDRQKAQGVDIASKWNITDSLEWQVNLTHLAKLERANADLDNTTDSAGEYRFPKNRINSSLKYSYGDMTHSLISYYIGSHGTDRAQTESSTKFDYQMRYLLGDHAITFMVANLTDENAPVNQNLSWPYYEQSLYSPLGRTYSLQWKYAFN